MDQKSEILEMIDPRYKRNEEEDFRLLVDSLYELKKKLEVLHPSVSFFAETLFQPGSL